MKTLNLFVGKERIRCGVLLPDFDSANNFVDIDIQHIIRRPIKFYGQVEQQEKYCPGSGK